MWKQRTWEYAIAERYRNKGYAAETVNCMLDYKKSLIRKFRETKYYENGIDKLREVMMKKILIHGSGHKSTSWNETISYMTSNEDIMCPNLSFILEGKEASYANLYSSFVKYCNKIDGQIHLCGISLGGILALN